MNRFSILVEFFKNGMAWGVIVGTVGDLILFFAINTNSYITPQITSLGIQPVWLYVIWPVAWFLLAGLWAVSIEYRQHVRDEDPSSELNMLGLNRDWRTAVNYLCAIDVMVNKKRKTFGLVEESTEQESDSFQKRFEELIEEIKKRNKELGKTIEEFAKVLWKIRTPIVHYGRVPGRKELEVIKSTAKKITEALSEI